ncbi:hypothetical protein PR048_005359 [Dryococelus australis]|uniref:Mutator-like transposase domain-containing protein n=1 Tax=Dryococelus australis TaxID=614101 RepID=A0ABQ9IA55_9NEOP|nr:hypothetical protein PR048_005359 [Dryococelus australis]
MIQPGIEEARLVVEAIDVEYGYPLATFVADCVTSTARSVIDTSKENKVSMHKHTRLIVDGNSSVHRRLIETLPYGPNLILQKSECRNRILRNYGNRLRDICMKKNFESAELRSLKQQNLLHLRTAVTKAVSYRKTPQVPHHKKNLRIETWYNE